MFDFFDFKLPLPDILPAKLIHPGPVLLLAFSASIPAVQRVDRLLIFEATPKQIARMMIRPDVMAAGFFKRPIAAASR